MGERFLRAYYWAFDPTGHDRVDAILEAVARAGKAYHHTSQWDEPWDLDDKGNESFWEVIESRAQNVANRLAALEQRVIVREDVQAMGYEVPEWAKEWNKEEDKCCCWFGKSLLDIDGAPDFRPDLDGPVTLVVVSLRNE